MSVETPLLDTHAWLWYANAESKLAPHELAALDSFDFADRPFLSGFSLWEVATLLNLNRVTLKIPPPQWLTMATKPALVRVIPISVDIALEVARLPESFHRDPADRVIVATARARDLPVLTRDRKIIDSGLVRIWKPE